MSQRFRDFEWLVIDGGSNDSTVNFLKSVDLVRYSWVSESDDGIFDGMRKGLEKASGEYVIFMNAGDLFADETVLERTHSVIGTDSPGLVYGDAIEFDLQGTEHYKPARSVSANRYSMFTHHQAQFYDLQLAKEEGFSAEYELSADWVLTTRVLRKSKAARIVGAVCRYQRGGVSMRRERRQQINKEMFRVHRYEQGLSLPIASLLSLVKIAANKLRAFAPSVYDRIRFGKAI